MRKNIAVEWLKASYTDLVVAEKILGDDFVTNVTAFHCQQSVEKSFKGILAFYNEKIPKQHDLLVLKDKIKYYLPITEEDILENLNELYIESRYPVDFGLLPDGKPSLDDARRFYDFAAEIFDQVCKILNIDKAEITRR